MNARVRRFLDSDAFALLFIAIAFLVAAFA